MKPHYLIAVLLAVFGYSEYQKLSQEVADAKKHAVEVSDEAVRVLESLRGTIDDIRGKLKAQDEQLAAIDSQIEQQVAKAVKAKQVEAPKKPTIVMHSSTSCGPCRDWELKDLPVWEKAGWKIEVIKTVGFPDSRTYPWYEITDGDGLRFTVEGKLTLDSYTQARKAAAR